MDAPYLALPKMADDSSTPTHFEWLDDDDNPVLLDQVHWSGSQCFIKWRTSVQRKVLR